MSRVNLIRWGDKATPGLVPTVLPVGVIAVSHVIRLKRKMPMPGTTSAMTKETPARAIYYFERRESEGNPKALFA